jgi:hypothetical protein
MTKTQTQKRWYITSTDGGHFILADNEIDAENIVEEEGYKVLDGMTEEYDKDMHGDWEGE